MIREVSPSEGPICDGRLQNEEECNGQNQILGRLEIEDDSKHFGDYQGLVQEGQIRLLFANINGIPAVADHPKNLMIKEAITKNRSIHNRVGRNKC
jgi:hypothetical protein